MRRLSVLLPVLLALLVCAAPALAWTWPVDGPVLKPFSFGENPFAAGLHRGIDIGAPAGAPVRAPAGGSVSFAGTVPGGGNTVTIQTSDGFAVTLVHLGSIAVLEGQPVGEGDLAGTIGPSGIAEHATPYVHLGVRIASDPQGYVDPLSLLPPPGSGPAEPPFGGSGEPAPVPDEVPAPVPSDGGPSEGAPPTEADTAPPEHTGPPASGQTGGADAGMDETQGQVGAETSSGTASEAGSAAGTGSSPPAPQDEDEPGEEATDASGTGLFETDEPGDDASDVGPEGGLAGSSDEGAGATATSESAVPSQEMQSSGSMSDQASVPSLEQPGAAARLTAAGYSVPGDQDGGLEGVQSASSTALAWRQANGTGAAASHGAWAGSGAIGTSWPGTSSFRTTVAGTGLLAVVGAPRKNGGVSGDAMTAAGESRAAGDATVAPPAARGDESRGGQEPSPSEAALPGSKSAAKGGAGDSRSSMLLLVLIGLAVLATAAGLLGIRRHRRPGPASPLDPGDRLPGLERAEPARVGPRHPPVDPAPEVIGMVAEPAEALLLDEELERLAAGALRVRASGRDSCRRATVHRDGHRARRYARDRASRSRVS